MTTDSATDVQGDNRAARLEGELGVLRAKLSWQQDQIRRMQSTKVWQLGSLYWRAHARVKSLLLASRSEREPLSQIDKLSQADMVADSLPLKASPSAGDPGSLCFRCNICGNLSVAKADELQRERPSCSTCSSTVRWRSIIRVLALELFGRHLDLPDFPAAKDIVGIGMTDWDDYAGALAQKFEYLNTFYDREPKLDIMSPPVELEGTCDFVISTDVFEHVPPPVSTAFENLRKLLRPTGVLVFSVPYGKQSETIEHFPELYDFRLVEKNGRLVLENITRGGTVQIFEDLKFHGGPGSTLEMRMFSEYSLLEEFRRAGFENVKIHSDPDFVHGIYYREGASLPISARSS